MQPQQRKYFAPALEKGLDILELLSEEESGLSLTEIARTLSRSVNEIFRMLAVLQERGYVAQDKGSGCYVITTYMFELSHKQPNLRRLTSIATPHMHQLANNIMQSTHLAILNHEFDVLVISQVDSPTNNVMSVRMGSQVDLWQSTSGPTILAFRPAEEIDRVLKVHPLPAGTSREQLDDNFESIRQTGHIVQDSLMVTGIVNISAPIFDHSGLSVAALTVPHINRITDEGVSVETSVQAITSTAKDLSSALGSNLTETPRPDIANIA